MSFAVVDYTENRWIRPIRFNDTIGEVSILLPEFRIERTKSYAKKAVRILNKNRINNVVLNNDLLNNDLFYQELVKNKKYVITGIRLYKVLILRVLKDISKQMNVNLEQLKIALLINEYSLENIDLIKTISKEVKSLCVVTTDREKYFNLIEELYEKYGIVLKVIDKTKVNLKYIQIVINIDFDNEDLNKINIGNNSILICGFANNYKIKQNFNGIVIKKIDIISGVIENSRLNNMALCEAKIYNYLRKIIENDRTFEREGYKINGYVGENGKILMQEFQSLGKIILDK